MSLVEDGKDGRDVKHKKKKIKKKGATLDAKSIGNLLEMIRNWDAKKKNSRKSILGRKHGRSGGGGIGSIGRVEHHGPP